MFFKCLYQSIASWVLDDDMLFCLADHFAWKILQEERGEKGERVQNNRKYEETLFLKSPVRKKKMIT